MSRSIAPLALALVTVLAAGRSSSAQARPLGPSVADFVAFKSVVGADAPVWLTDGRVVYLSNEDGALWAVPARGGTAARISGALATNDPQPVSRANLQLKASPDGRRLSYVKGVSGGNDIFVLDPATKVERRVSRIAGHVRSYSFSPDGKWIALANDRMGSEDIWVVNVDAGDAKRITTDPRYEVFPSWSPDGSEIIFVRMDDDWIDHEVLAVPRAGGQPRHVLTDRDYFDYRQGASFGFARVLPDNQRILFRSQRSGWANYWLAPLTGGEPHPLAAEQADQSEARISPDGKLIAFLSIANGTQTLKVVPVGGGAARTVAGTTSGMVSKAEWSPDGRQLSYVYGTATTPPDLFVVSTLGGTATQLTWSDRGKLASQLITPEKISWNSDGFTINAYLWKPKGLRVGERVPVIMYVHGGPTSQFADAFQLQPQFFASRGYAVIAPNVRGSSGYGKDFENANNHDWGHGDLRDVVAGVDWAKSQPYVNSHEIGITGISYGGILTMYAVSFAPDVFQAAISGSGYGDVRDFHSKVPVLQHRKLLEYELGHWPSTPAVDSIYRRSSAILKVGDVTTPTMLIHGSGLDELDTYYPAFEFARALAGRAKLVEYRNYPHETYYVYRADNTRAMLKDMLEFFDRYLKDDGAGTATAVANHQH
ncbi:MAG: S9 family peptidase [Gemmatimonadaceae bacterium]